MVDIISRRDGPRREDVAARRLISENSATIRKLADNLSGGGYSAGLTRPKVPKAPEASGLITHDLKAPRAKDEAKPFIRISVNNRVVMADMNSGRQLEFLGEIRREGGQRHFRLARKQNGFFSEMDEELSAALADLDGVMVGGSYPEKSLAADIGARLGLT
ncbi:MAG: hypothetical protein KDK03_12680 [Rhodobacteraceae bacterium]|uniref:hypothetical protein n=1 Tax=Amaricoccus sp. B4 TaxID=3368557 RepID=UPI000DAD9E98|nr:hypothetical protein [Paracoccaceae bacterium]